MNKNCIINLKYLINLLLFLLTNKCVKACIGSGGGTTCCPQSTPACPPSVPVCPSYSYSSGGGSYAAPHARPLAYVSNNCATSSQGCVSAYQNAPQPNPSFSNANVPLALPESQPYPAEFQQQYVPPLQSPNSQQNNFYEPPQYVPNTNVESSYDDINHEHNFVPTSPPYESKFYESKSQNIVRAAEQEVPVSNINNTYKSDRYAINAVPVAHSPYKNNVNNKVSSKEQVHSENNPNQSDYDSANNQDKDGNNFNLRCDDPDLRRIVEDALSSNIDNLKAARKIENEAGNFFGSHFNSIVSNNEFAYVNWYGKRNCQLRINNRHSLTWEVSA